MIHHKLQLCFFALVALSVAGCTFFDVSPEQKFKVGLDARINWNIGRYQSQNGVNFARSEETLDGKVEYFYEYKTRGFFDPAGSMCRYVMIVDKSSQVTIGWRFNGQNDYCRVSN